AMLATTVFLSEEVQLLNVSQTARISPLKGQQYIDNFGAGSERLSSKNLSSIFKSKPAPYIDGGFSLYFTDARNIFRQKMVAVLNGEMDVNTALRQAEEEINQFIAANPR